MVGVSTESSTPPTRSTAPELFGSTVSTQWLADHLGAEDLVVLDASVFPAERADGTHGWTGGRQNYLAKGHIP